MTNERSRLNRPLSEPARDNCADCWDLFHVAGGHLSQPIINGVGQIVQQSAEGLQIGLYKGFVEPETPIQGYYSVVAAPMGSIDVSNLAVDNAKRLVYFDSRTEVDAAYLVFTIDRFTARNDWKQIPDVKKVFAALLAAEQSADRSKITDAMTSFKVVVAVCQDLLIGDRTSVISAVQSQVDQLLSQLPAPHGSVLSLETIRLPESSADAADAA